MDEEETLIWNATRNSVLSADSEDQNDLDLLKHLVKNSRYICSTCGRSAASE